MRPRLGKGKWWDKVTPTEQKKIDATTKKWIVIKWIHGWTDKDGGYWSRWAYAPHEDSETVRWGITNHPNAEVIMEKLNERDARMWAKMMD